MPSPSHRNRAWNLTRPRTSRLSWRALLVGGVLATWTHATPARADDELVGEPAPFADATSHGETDLRTGSDMTDPPVEDEPVSASANSIPQTTTEASGLYVEFGRGVNISSDDGNFRLTIRGRLQVRGTYRQPDDPDEEAAIFFQARRARLVFLGTMRDQNLQLYLQLGLGASDLESDRQVPLRDAVITWTPFRGAGVRVGQMKVPFSRERIISSSALQFADRSIVNAEFNLDRDVGVQIFSNDLFDLGERLSFQLGVFGGEGRNRASEDLGLLYAGRFQYQPFGQFEDSLVEADLTRARRVRLSVGVAAGYNQRARRTLSSHGAFYNGISQDNLHASADLLFKYAGLSIQSEAIYREALRTRSLTDEPVSTNTDRSGWGWMIQSGYLTASGFEVSSRWSMVNGLPDSETVLSDERRVEFGLGQYVRNHDLKIQADIGFFSEDLRHPLGYEGRVQAQFFF